MARSEVEKEANPLEMDGDVLLVLLAEWGRRCALETVQRKRRRRYIVVG
jgi:hypothetical protein